jgi:hypothetical protein
MVLLLVQPEDGCQRHAAGLAAQKSHIMHAALRHGLQFYGAWNFYLDIDDVDARKGKSPL